jgi:hypothetical protein
MRLLNGSLILAPRQREEIDTRCCSLLVASRVFAINAAQNSRNESAFKRASINGVLSKRIDSGGEPRLRPRAPQQIRMSNATIRQPDGRARYDGLPNIERVSQTADPTPNHDKS